MKVLLVSINRERLPDPVFPLGPAYVAGALEAAGQDVAVLDLCFVDDEALEATIATMIDDYRPDVVGLSLRNVDDAVHPKVTSYLGLYRQVVEICRRSTSVPLVVGGSGFTIMPEAFLEALDVDFGVVGEGERVMVELVEQLEADRSASSKLPAGVLRRGEGASSRPKRLDDWGAFRPARQHFAAATYYEKGGMLNLQTRRGCPYRCIYCSYPRIEGSIVRLRSVRDAVDELEWLVQETGVRHVFIVDSVFTHPKHYALAFCDEIIARRLDVRWSCYAHAGELDGELIERMLRAGCEGVELGTDALVDEVLEVLRKGFTWADVSETSRLCRELGLHFAHFLFLGAPGEGPDDVRLAVDRLAELEADSSLIMTGIRIFPGTALATRARAELGLDHIGLEPVFYVSPRVVGQLESLVDDIIAAHPNWVLPGFQQNFNERIQKILRRTGKRGVLWDFLSPRHSPTDHAFSRSGLVQK